jgi:hypothetical protein
MSKQWYYISLGYATIIINLIFTHPRSRILVGLFGLYFFLRAIYYGALNDKSKER